MGALVITKLWVSYIAINQNIKVTVKEPLNRQKNHIETLYKEST